MEFSSRIENLLRDIARAQGRSEEEVLVEALEFYVRNALPEDEPDIGRPIRRTRRQIPELPGVLQRDGFLALLDRMSSRFALDEDEAMRIAVVEQQAFRREQAEREEAER